MQRGSSPMAPKKGKTSVKSVANRWRKIKGSYKAVVAFSQGSETPAGALAAEEECMDNILKTLSQGHDVESAIQLISREELSQLASSLAMKVPQSTMLAMAKQKPKQLVEGSVIHLFKKTLDAYVDSHTSSSSKVKDSFKVFEGPSPSGQMPIDVLERVLTLYGDKGLSLEQVQMIMNSVDANEKGYFNYDKYIAMMTGT